MTFKKLNYHCMFLLRIIPEFQKMNGEKVTFVRSVLPDVSYMHSVINESPWKNNYENDLHST